MKTLYNFLWGALLASGMLTAVLLLASAVAGCATEQAALTTGPQLFAQATETAQPAVVQLPAGGKYKFKGPVSIVLQAGTGNVATPTVTGTDKTAQRAQAVSTGDNSPVKASQEKGGVPWWVFGIVAVVAVAAWEYLRRQLNPLGWLPWRAKT